MAHAYYVETPNSEQHTPSSTPHPENAERLVHIRRGIQDAQLFSNGLVELNGITGSSLAENQYDNLFQELSQTHDARYLRKLARACLQASTKHEQYIDLDTYITPDTLDVILQSVASVKAATEAAVSENASAFCALRPPGHHAGRQFFGGFCVVNFAAYAANLSHKLGAEKVAIIDWDAHYGNGTQSIFNKDPDTFYLSLHGTGQFPRGGGSGDVGEGRGKGFSRNITLKAGSGDEQYKREFESGLTYVRERIKPDVLVISAGFDGHVADPLGSLALSSDVYGELTDMVRDSWKNAPIISVLEGGYDPRALKESTVSHIKSLLK